MLLTCCGDVHADNSNLDKVEKLFSIVEEFGNPVVWLGDLFHTKEIIRGKTLNKLLGLFKESKLDHHLVVGNHDLFHVLDTESALEVLNLFENVTVYKNPASFKGLGFMPYKHDYQDILLGLEQLKNCQVIFMHQGVSGFDYGNGLIADGTRGGEISFEDLKGKKLVVSGHFHRPAELGNVVYVGAPFSHDFGESNMDTRIITLNTQTLEISSIGLNFPKHTTVRVDASNTKKAVHEIKKLHDLAKVNPTRVILVGSKSDIKAINTKMFQGIKFSESITDVGPREEDIIFMAADNQTRFKMWAESSKIPKKIIDLGISYLRGDQ